MVEGKSEISLKTLIGNNENKYVPILKYKAAEIDALKQLRTEYKNNEMILPVIRLVAGNDPSKRYKNFTKQLKILKGSVI